MKKMSVLAPSTRRSAKTLADFYGFDSPRAMAESLPKDARVADIGAGQSKLGRTITDLRDDVTWLNVDLRTGLFRFSQRQQRDSAPGLQYLKADIFHLPVASGSLDRVYSSWLLPHIRLDSQELAIQAVHNMAALLKHDGVMAVAALGSETVAVAEYYDAPQATAERMVNTVAFGPISGFIQRANNIARGVLFLDRLP